MACPVELPKELKDDFSYLLALLFVHFECSANGRPYTKQHISKMERALVDLGVKYGCLDVINHVKAEMDKSLELHPPQGPRDEKPKAIKIPWNEAVPIGEVPFHIPQIEKVTKEWERDGLIR